MWKLVKSAITSFVASDDRVARNDRNIKDSKLCIFSYEWIYVTRVGQNREKFTMRNLSLHKFVIILFNTLYQRYLAFSRNIWNVAPDSDNFRINLSHCMSQPYIVSTSVDSFCSDSQKYSNAYHKKFFWLRISCASYEISLHIYL